jgi:hypothetical protein
MARQVDDRFGRYERADNARIAMIQQGEAEAAAAREKLSMTTNTDAAVVTHALLAIYYELAADREERRMSFIARKANLEDTSRSLGPPHAVR